jgi:hypothetical protein
MDTMKSSYGGVGYSGDYRIRHEAEQARLEAEAEEAAAQNAAIRQRIEQEVEAARQAKLAEAEAEFDQQVEAEKIQLRRQWLADHPDQRAEDFEKRAWPHLRANLKERACEAALEANKQALLRTGNYAGL